MVRLTLAEIEVQNAKACVLLNFACICKFEHTDRESGVAVGIVTNQHTSPTTGDFFYDIRFARLIAKVPNQQLKTGQILCTGTRTLMTTWHSNSICTTSQKLGRKLCSHLICISTKGMENFRKVSFHKHSQHVLLFPC